MVRETGVSEGRYLLIQRYFAGEVDLNKGFWNPKRNLGVAAYSLEITELKFGKKMPCFVMYFKAS